MYFSSSEKVSLEYYYCYRTFVLLLKRNSLEVIWTVEHVIWQEQLYKKNIWCMFKCLINIINLLPILLRHRDILQIREIEDSRHVQRIPNNWDVTRLILPVSNAQCKKLVLIIKNLLESEAKHKIVRVAILVRERLREGLKKSKICGIFHTARLLHFHYFF